MSGEHVVWRNARIATCNAQLEYFIPGAMVTFNERIEWVGPQSQLPAVAGKHYDLQGRWLTPGLIDCHTHLVFAGNRAAEWRELQAGVSYAQIAQRGGGILSTVRATRAATEAELFDAAASRLESLVAEGVTTVEIKSGYGLTLADERKMLRVARALARHYPVTILTTFLAAHVVPPEFAGRADDYVTALIVQWLPALHAEGLVDAVDVFCEHIAFDVRQAERLLQRAQQLSVPIRMHAEQLANIGATQLATRYDALSCDHLEYSTASDVSAMARTGTVAVLLPIAWVHLQMTQLPPLAALRQAQVPIAVASDCNPGSAPCASLQLAMSLAARVFGLRPDEVLVGATRNAARALGETRCGVLAAGHLADFAIWDVDALEEMSYWLGRNGCRTVVRHGLHAHGYALKEC